MYLVFIPCFTSVSFRNVLKLENANSTEIEANTNDPVIIDMPEHTQGDMGGTMRLGKRKTIFRETNAYSSKLSKYILATIFPKY